MERAEIAGKLPCCGYVVTAATGIYHDYAPRAGDYTICVNCGAVLRFRAEGPPQEVGLEALELPIEAMAPMALAIAWIRARGRFAVTDDRADRPEQGGA